MRMKQSHEPRDPEGGGGGGGDMGGFVFFLYSLCENKMDALIIIFIYIYI